MPLIPMRVLLDHAAENSYGVAAFNVNNMEQIQAIMQAATYTDSPVIVQASRGARASSILALVGFVNVPIIKFSVDWWNTLHQPASVIKMGGSAIHPSMLMPLLLMGVGFTSYYFWVLLIRIRGEICANKVRSLRLRQVHEQPSAGDLSEEAS